MHNLLFASSSFFTCLTVKQKEEEKSKIMVYGIEQESV